ncbi:hypothetical protein JF66_21345 [Cryobacterium sp. MLB-32]|uniref:helix-turn-helix transcriptional regulator n=1 Tax=Cryobacterium sp. MLB-32 TaxID=1529318 RepID=UPI0004E6D705|nr:helix-turn-helix transcriptional regulator [Cryobacterium sp. MLB-32]KFF58074.1 hypothetical protein JF66_21345 [Cryobacterium sp. MLB-32]
MTDFLGQTGIGNRIQAIRKQHGIRSTKDLADAIPGDNVTESILQNIEAGRKQDLSVSQLLNIAKALNVTPIFLLTPIGRPHARLDIANLSSSFDGMTVVEFDAWISGDPQGAYRWTTYDEHSERTQLQAMRELDKLTRERKRLASNLDVERSLSSAAGETGATQPWDTTEERLSEANRRISQLSSYLATAGWKLDGWAG